MNQNNVQDKVKEIKQSFRLYMNGITAQSIREKGSDYKISWGVSRQHLQEMASEYNKDYQLATELWKSEVRECKLLATMLMPEDEMPEELVEIWIEQIHTQELAEMLTFNLLQHLTYASRLAYKWLASDKTIYQLCAYNILGLLFAKKQIPNDRGINEFIDQALTALKSEDSVVSHAAMNCFIRFADLGKEYENIARKATHEQEFDFI